MTGGEPPALTSPACAVNVPPPPTGLSTPPAGLSTPPVGLSTTSTTPEPFDAAEFVKFALVTLLVIIVRFLESILQSLLSAYEGAVKVYPMFYNAARFCYEKPDVAKDLVATSWHLASVSYHNGLWSFTDAFKAFFGNSIGKMNELEEKEDAKNANPRRSSRSSSLASSKSKKPNTKSTITPSATKVK